MISIIHLNIEVDLDKLVKSMVVTTKYVEAAIQAGVDAIVQDLQKGNSAKYISDISVTSNWRDSSVTVSVMHT